MPQFRFAETDDARIRYLDSGGDDCGAPVVFVPGFTCVADDYVEILPALGRRAAIVELRGHGHSTGTGRFDSEALTGDVGAVVDALTAGPVHIMSFSRGTTYALLWALTHRDRVLSVSIGDYVPEEIELSDDTALGLLGGRWRGTPVSERVDRDAGLATIRSARTQSLWEPLARWQPPLLVIRSPNAPIVDDDAWARYRDEFPGATMREFPDSPHDIFRPERNRYPVLVREHIESR